MPLERNFLQACEQQAQLFNPVIRKITDNAVLGARLSVNAADFRASDAAFIEILHGSRYWVSGERLVFVGYRGLMVLLGEYQFIDHELNPLNPKCRLCQARVADPPAWMQHVTDGRCIVINPMPWFPIIRSLPFLNNV